MGMLSFLKSASVEEVKDEPKRAGGGKAKQWNPNPALLAIRVWFDGRVFPSQSLVDKFDLEYKSGTVKVTPAVEEVGIEGAEGYVAGKPESRKVEAGENAGNGFDVIDSRVWGGYKGEGHMLFIAPVKRGEPKIDLFGATVYDKDGKPKSSVMEQGAATFGASTLVDAIEQLYGTTFKRNETELAPAVDGVEFVDMLVASDVEIEGGTFDFNTFSKPIANFPKRIVRGESKGKADYVRRENATIFGFIPSTLEEDDELQEVDSTIEDPEVVES